MNAQLLKGLTLSAAIAAALASGNVLAQDNQPTDNAPANATQKAENSSKNGKSVKSLDQVVVTGSANSTGVRKIDASYQITTATDAQIQQTNPRSAADLLKLSPGVWPESSGGETGANIEIAGFPGGGRRAVLHQPDHGHAAVRHAVAVVLRAELDVPPR